MSSTSIGGRDLRWFLRLGLLVALPAVVARPVRGEEEGGTPP